MWMDTEESNERVLELLGRFLNESSTSITEEMMDDYCRDLPFGREQAYRYLMAASMNLDMEGTDRELFHAYFPEMVHRLDAAEYEQNPYLRTVHLSRFHKKEWQFAPQSYQPYEAFVMDDFQYRTDGRAIPQIGFFETSYSFPCVRQNGQEWMTITPNEINTMKQPVEQACGNVLTYGLGLGYFAFMCSEKDSVSSITVIEKDQTVIDLFERHILPQFPNRHKIRIICEDAFEYAAQCRENYDLTFVDLWHDAGDGIKLYQKFKPLEHGLTEYWIYDTMKYYLERE